MASNMPTSPAFNSSDLENIDSTLTSLGFSTPENDTLKRRPEYYRTRVPVSISNSRKIEKRIAAPQAYVVCPNIDSVVYDMDPDPSAYPVVVRHDTTNPNAVEAPDRRADFRIATNPDPAVRNAVLPRIWAMAYHWLKVCQECECEDGQVTEGRQGSKCDYYAALECPSWYNCYCFLPADKPLKESMHKDPHRDGDALGVLTQWEKLKAKHHDSLPLIRGSIPPQKPVKADEGFSISVHKESVASTNEPYYVEGPSKGQTWDWLRNLRGLRNPLMGISLGASYAAFLADATFNRNAARLRGAGPPITITRRAVDGHSDALSAADETTVDKGGAVPRTNMQGDGAVKSSGRRGSEVDLDLVRGSISIVPLILWALS
ncbi:hypothetical protein Dda_4543 [Drechslerella dactyloides]|uniref:Uncharacterized protein n=1 Tax=Drechslerella dactyloides TaxID=74499 RepID=A0AAD6NKP7_DREDA|nr:hypothetical protein Dda_4543 [Drechslerella dactyloides]